MELPSEKEEEKWKMTRKGFVEELKKLSYMALPLVFVAVSQYLLQVISVMMVGHLGELALSGIALAASFTNVTGYSFIVDTYGGWGAHGGGAFSGKDSTKMDRSGAYIARQAAKSIVEQ